MNTGRIKPFPCAYRHAPHCVIIPIFCLWLSLRSEASPWREPCWRAEVRRSLFFSVPKAPREEIRVQKKERHCTVLSGDKADDRTSGYCLVVVYSCTYSLDKFHCLWYKTPSGTGNLLHIQSCTHSRNCSSSCNPRPVLAEAGNTHTVPLCLAPG